MATFRNIVVEFDQNGIPTGNAWQNGERITIPTANIDALSPAPGVTVKITFPVIDLNDDITNQNLAIQPQGDQQTGTEFITGITSADFGDAV